MSLRKNNLKRLGILGGTFDPPHFGHVEISKFTLKKFKLSSLIWAVTKKNPLKKPPVMNLKERVNLCEDLLGKPKLLQAFLIVRICLNKNYAVN